MQPFSAAMDQAMFESDAMAPMPAASYTPVDLSLFDDNFGM
jgi:hypothetical protein